MSKSFQWYLTRDNFLSESECQEIIDIVDSGRDNLEPTQAIELKEDKYLNKVWKIMKLSNDIHYNFDIDCVQLQEGKYYKKGVFKEEETLHSDFAAGPDRLVDINTKLTSVVFLNDDYWGGGLQIWNDKIESKGWSPKYSLNDGIRELINGYQIIINKDSSNFRNAFPIKYGQGL